MKEEDKTKEQQRGLERSLAERVKELRCLYGIADIAERPGITLDEIYQEVDNLFRSEVPSDHLFPPFVLFY